VAVLVNSLLVLARPHSEVELELIGPLNSGTWTFGESRLLTSRGPRKRDDKDNLGTGDIILLGARGKRCRFQDAVRSVLPIARYGVAGDKAPGVRGVRGVLGVSPGVGGRNKNGFSCFGESMIRA